MTPDAEKLKAYISALSEQAYSASWMQHLEYVLWPAVENGPRKYGCLSISQEHIDILRRLWRKSGGWIRWHEDSGETWIALDDWKRMFLNRLPDIDLE